MSEQKPPCECCEKDESGVWTYRCECSNGGDAESAAWWCADANARATIATLTAELAAEREKVAKLREAVAGEIRNHERYGYVDATLLRRIHEETSE